MRGRWSPAGRLALIAVGKAAPAMATAFVETVRRPVDAGLVIGTHLDRRLPPPLVWHSSSHPVPDARSVEGARAALALAAGLELDDTLVVLISGGTSALMAAPAEGLTLADKQEVTRQLLRQGADITALNTVRKHLSSVKGGRLAAAARCRVHAWLLSDVVGDDPSVIGSGPTVPDPTTFEDALGVLERFGGRTAYPSGAVAHLTRGAAHEFDDTPKPDASALALVETTVIGSARVALRGAADRAERLGYDVVIRPDAVVGEARDAAALHLAWAQQVWAQRPGRLCLLSAGETTVQVTGTGRGGRNQELALAAVPLLPDAGRAVALASVGTDGVDGPTDAAGAIVDSGSAARARAMGLEPAAALAANDAWTFFHALGDLVVTGPTDTNVGDVQILLVGPAR